MRGFVDLAMLAVTVSSWAQAGDVTPPHQVFILMGQSNMLGEGKIEGAANGSLEFAVKTEKKYPYLLNSSTGNWTTSRTVRNVFTMASGGPTANARILHNEWMTDVIWPWTKEMIDKEVRGRKKRKL